MFFLLIKILKITLLKTTMSPGRSLSPNPQRLEWMSITNFPTQASLQSPGSHLVWNARGAGCQEFQNALRNLITQYQPIMTIVIDTRTTYQRSEEIIRSLPYSNSAIFSPPLDAPRRGGYWVLYNAEEVDIREHKINERVYHVNTVHPAQPFPVNFRLFTNSLLRLSSLRYGNS